MQLPITVIEKNCKKDSIIFSDSYLFFTIDVFTANIYIIFYFICRSSGESNEMYFCEQKQLAMTTLRMTSEAKVCRCQAVAIIMCRHLPSLLVS